MKVKNFSRLILILLFSGLIPTGCKLHCGLIYPKQLSFQEPTFTGSATTNLYFNVDCDIVSVKPSGGLGNKTCFGTSIEATYKYGNRITDVTVTSDSTFNGLAPGTDLRQFIQVNEKTVPEFIESLKSDFLAGYGSYSLYGMLTFTQAPTDSKVHNITMTLHLEDNTTLSDNIKVSWP
ncbi:MAG: hypothetical protein U0V74_07965 [Chitinophagales bacterium]